MKTTLTFLTLLGLVVLTGCSADDLTGPDADAPFTQATADSDQAARSEASFTAATFSPAGAWRASDASGSIILFLDELGASPDASPNAAGALEGKGVVSDGLNKPFAVTVEGEFEVHDIAFTLSDDGGTAILKAEGSISRDFSLIKVVLYDGTDQERELTFERI